MKEKMKKTQQLEALQSKIKLLSILFIVLFLTSFASAIELNPFATAKILDKEITLDTPEFLKADFNNDYGTIKLSKTLFWIQTDKIAEYSLTKTEGSIIDSVAYGKAVLYSDGKLFDDANFKNIKGLDESLSYQYFILSNVSYTEQEVVGYKQVCSTPVSNGTIKGELEVISKEVCEQVPSEYKDVIKYRGEWTAYNYENLKTGNYEWKVEFKRPVNKAIDLIPKARGKELTEWAWFNSSWGYKRQISNLTGAISFIKINNSDVNGDFESVRFTNSTGDGELNYTISSLDSGSGLSYENFNDTSSSLLNGLVSYYKFDEPSGTVAIDSTGNVNATNVGATVGVAGKIGTAYDFDGATDVVRRPFVNLGNAFTVSVWANISDANGIGGIVSEHQGGTTGNWLIGMNNGKLKFGRSASPVDTTYTINNAGLIHIVVVRDGANNLWKGYVNGVLVYSFTDTTSTPTDSAYHLVIGNENSTGWGLDAMIDEVLIKNVSMTDSEVRELYNATAVNYRIANNLDTSIYMYYGNKDAVTTSNAGNVYFNPVSMYYLDETSGTTAYDSLNINNGAISGATLNQAGKIGTAYDFEQADAGDRITFASRVINPASAHSVSFWIKPEAYSTYGRIITQTNPASWDTNSWAILLTQTTGKLQVAKASYSNLESTTALTAGQWYFVVVTSTGTSSTIYINGTAEDTETVTFVGNYNTYFGYDAKLTTELYDGLLDEVGVYNKALTSTEITSLYNTTAPVYIMGDAQTIEGIGSLDYVTPPTLVDFTNISVEYIPIKINYTLNSANITNITYSLRNINGTNYTLFFTNETIDINFTNIPDAHYHYDATICATGISTTVYCSTTAERHINHDATAPQFTLNSLPDVSTTTLPVNNTFNITTTDPALSICKYSTSEDPTNITYTCNTSVTISFATGGVKAVTVYANDTYGNSNQTTYSFNLYDFVVVQSGDATGSEGTDQTFTLDVYSTSFPIGDANAVLYYNGTNQGVDTKTNFNSTLVQFSKTIALWNGSGNSTGYPQSWLWNYNTTYLTTRNTSTQTQNVYSVSITDCDLTSGRVILNLSLKDEELNSLVNVTSPNLATIEVDLYVSSLSNSSLQWHFYKKWSNNNTATICVPNNLLNSSSYKIEFTVGYDATDHVREFYYLENGTLDNTNYFNSYTDNTIDLMDLLTADSTTFLFSYTDSAKQEVDDIIVHTFRKYIGEGLFREVERSKQDNNGQTHVHLVEEDVIYYFMITQYGNILYTSDTYNAKCLSTPCSIELSASQTSFNWSIIDNEGGKYSTTANKTTRVATTTFALDTISLVNVSLYKFNGTSVLINSSSLTSGSGSIPLTVPLSYGNATFYVVIYKNNTFVKSSWVDLTDRGQDYFGTAGAILGGLIVLALLLMAVSEGVGAIIFTCLALVVITIMKLIDLNWFALISLICAGGIIVWKLVRRQGVKG